MVYNQVGDICFLVILGYIYSFIPFINYSPFISYSVMMMFIMMFRFDWMIIIIIVFMIIFFTKSAQIPLSS